MNIERNHDLERRAALHAALSDPARLAIVDTLALGDASPSELRESLGMASNLIAFHLKVLEDVGLLTRTRSEADKRRSYVQLVPGVLDELHVTGTLSNPATAGRVVFVCTAASARSQLAAALWRRASTVPAAAAGTHPAEHVDPGAIDTARRHGVPLRRARPQALSDVTADGDFVITVCDNAFEELGDLPDLHWSVPDPVRIGALDAYEAAFTELTRRVTDLAPRIRAS